MKIPTSSLIMSDWPLALQAPDVKIRREMLCGNFLLEAWRKANSWAFLDNNKSHTPTTAST